ncbi:PREDICTED: balbiani ring protein 3-like [Dufourea novaeangliae]|uniref:balbiani ring protein 3-like n=1 Tax=Dufourea novaeangliae TaxID=178035 RepID=UPI00076795F7|nr:PREDICTED: balbiani ring protein 3-like [Dufourea novaeangliae]
MRQAKCMPRVTMVNLDQEPGYMYFPSMVTVKRCEGFCGNNLSCMPIDTHRKAILVKKSGIFKVNDMTCHKVLVEEHTKCRCRCNVMKHHCNRYQEYSEETCSCMCMNFSEQAECKRLKNMVWNSEKCKCTCSTPEEECSTGLEWLPSRCMCVRVMMMGSGD